MSETIPKLKAKQFTEAIVEHVRSLRLGSGLEPRTDVGPMIGDTYRAKIETHVEDARARGTQVLTGGQRPRNIAKGWFYEQLC